MLARGTVAGGFGKPLELTAHGAGGLYVAQLSSGVTYVAWDDHPNGPFRWRIAAIQAGHVSGSTPLPVDINLWGLFAGRDRGIAAVWNTLGSRYSIHYAFLGPHGRVSRQGNITTSRQDFMNPLVALNDRGELAAVWTQTPDTPVLALCAPGGRCAAPRRLPIPGAVTAVALADSGTTVVLGGDKGAIGGYGPGPHPLWGVIAHVGGRAERVVRMSAVGYRPVATADGEAGVLALVEPMRDALASTFLRPSGNAFTAPKPIPDRMVDQDFTVLAANLKGEFVAAWNHFTAFSNGSNEIRASLGRGTTTGKPVTIAGASEEPYPDTIRTGIDGHGNAVVTWSRYSGQGNLGLFESIHLRH